MSTQRQRRPPGGASSLSLAWCEDSNKVPSSARCSSNAFANGGRQNSQNVLTDMPTTRVLAPPGGASSFSLAWEDSSSSSRPSTSEVRRQAQTPPCGRQHPCEEEEEEDVESSAYLDAYSNAAFGRRPHSSSSNNFANGINQNCGNVLTDRPSTRVKAPPGGASSFTLGWHRNDDEHRCRTPSSVQGVMPVPRTPPRTSPGNTETPELQRRDHQPFSENDSRMSDIAHVQQQQRRTSNAFSYGGNQDSRNSLTGTPSTRAGEGYANEPGCRSAKHPNARDHIDFDKYSYTGDNLTPRTSECSGFGRRTPPRTRNQTDDAFGQRTRKSSSNLFAHGSNQNCGNVLTDTPSTRVAAPPGGASSLTLGEEFCREQPDQRTPRVSNAWDVCSNYGGSTYSRSSVRAGTGVRPKTPPKTPPRTPPRVSEGDDCFGQRAQKSSSNLFACGSNQNCGNSITETPTTRVAEPPGGRSSVALGWDYDATSEVSAHSTPRGHSNALRSPKPNGRVLHGSANSEYEPSEMSVPSCAAGKPTFDKSALRTLKAKMGKKQFPSSASQAGSQIYDERGYGNSSTTASEVERSSSVPLLHPKAEVQGSQPRKWKPARAPKAPPGGNSTFHPAKDGTSDTRFDGRKRFPDMGAGNNRDMNAIEALRFYQEEERLGKNADYKVHLTANNHARDSHRYYLAAEGKTDLIPGKAKRRPSDPSVRGLLDLYDSEVPVSESNAPSQSIAPGNKETSSECDSLPLGAEWSSCRFDRFDRFSSTEQIKA